MKRIVAGAICALVLIGPAAPVSPGAQGRDRRPEVDLSPASWPAGELRGYSELNLRSRYERGQARSRKGMVVGTTGALAVRSGIEALRQGGSAVDAAIVTTLTQVTLAAGSWVSFAGILSMVHYDADLGKLAALNGEFNTVLAEDDPLSIPGVGASGRTALVPGFMAAIEGAHRRYGVLPWDTLFEPAIYFAEEGFEVDADLGATIASKRDLLDSQPAAREIFFKSDGSLYGAGDRFRQPQLAATLRAVARDGADYMYTGAWGEDLIAALAAAGGKMSMQDLASYQALWKKPRRAKYRGHVVHSPNPGGGGVLASRTFKKLKAFDLRQLGHYTESAEALFQLMRITREAYDAVPPLNHSDGVITVDPAGSVVALLHSINTNAWGNTGIFVGGVSIPDAAAHQQRRIRDAGPGQRIWTGTNPLIVTKNRKPVLASSAIGRGLFEETVQSVVNAIDYGMTPKRAIAAGSFRAPRRSDGPVAEWPTLVSRGDFSKEILDEVRSRGIPIVELVPFDPDSLGYWIGVQIKPKKGKLAGATVSDFNGHAEGL